MKKSVLGAPGWSDRAAPLAPAAGGDETINPTNTTEIRIEAGPTAPAIGREMMERQTRVNAEAIQAPKRFWPAAQQQRSWRSAK